MGADVMDDEKCVTVGDVTQWHGMGPHFKTPISAVEGEEAIGGSFKLYKQKAGVLLDDPDFAEWVEDENGEWVLEEAKFQPTKGRWAIVRGPSRKDKRNVVFDFVTDDYHIVQPHDIVEMFDEKVGVSISSMGFLGDGRKMFLSWNLPSIEVIQGQEVKLFATSMFGFDSDFSSRLSVGSTVVVCANTWRYALSEAAQNDKAKKKGRGTIYSGKHTNPRLLYELGEWMEFIQINAEREVELVSGLFNQFKSTRIVHEKQAEDLLAVAWPEPAPVPDAYPVNLRKKEEERVYDLARKNNRTRQGVYDLFTGSKGINITEDYFGLFNACTQYFNHEQPSKRDTAYSIMWGNRSDEMNMFAEVLRQDIQSKASL